MDHRVLSVLKKTHPIIKEIEQNRLLQKLTRSRSFQAVKVPSSLNKLTQQFALQNEHHLLATYKNILNTSAILILTRDLQKGFDKRKTLDIPSINISPTIFPSIVKIRLIPHHRYKLLAFDTAESFINNISSVQSDEFSNIDYVLVNGRMIPIKELNIYNDFDSGVVNYETLLKKGQRNENPVEKVLSRISELGLLKVIIREELVIFEKNR